MRRRGPIPSIAVGALAMIYITAHITACAAPSPPPRPAPLPGHTTHRVSGDTTPVAPADFDPPPALMDPLPGDPRVPGADYLESAAGAIQARWSSFLEDLRLRLPPSHPLNRAKLSATLAFVVSIEGAVSELAVAASSGEADFDLAALEVLRDASPLPRPPAEVAGDDGVTRLRWGFARDMRQAGVATAALEPTRWPPARAVPQLISRGKPGEAASRLALEGPDAAVLDVQVRASLMSSVAHALLLSAVKSKRPEVAAAAMRGAASLEARELIEPIAAIARAPGGVARAAAFAALAALGGSETAAIGRQVALDPDTPEAVVADAARTWAAADLGEPRGVDAAVTELLAESDPDRRRRAFVIAGATAVKAALPHAIALVDGGGERLGVPVIARLAARGDRAAIARCASGLGSTSAETRLYHARELASSAARGERARAQTLRSALLRRQRDADERVRAAAVAALPPSAVAGAVAGWSGERSPLVLVALARALGSARGARATRELGSLAGHSDASVRAAAARALWGRPGASRWLAPLRSDRDPVVREAALAAASRAELEGRIRGGQPGREAALAALYVDGAPDPRLVANVMASDDEGERLAAAVTWLHAQNRAKLKR